MQTKRLALLIPVLTGLLWAGQSDRLTKPSTVAYWQGVEAYLTDQQPKQGQQLGYNQCRSIRDYWRPIMTETNRSFRWNWFGEDEFGEDELTKDLRQELDRRVKSVHRPKADTSAVSRALKR